MSTKTKGPSRRVEGDGVGAGNDNLNNLDAFNTSFISVSNDNVNKNLDGLPNPSPPSIAPMTPSPQKTVFDHDDNKNNNNDSGDCSSSCSTSSTSGLDYFAVAGRINLSGRGLMSPGEDQSPGAVLLTEAGLKQHEKKVFQESVLRRSQSEGSQVQRQPPPPLDSFAAWQTEREKRQYYRQRLAARDKSIFRRQQESEQQHKLQLQRSDSSNRENARPSPEKQSSLTKVLQSLGGGGHSPSIRLGRKKLSAQKEDVTDFSLAPLSAMEHLNLNQVTQQYQPPPPPSSPPPAPPLTEATSPKKKKNKSFNGWLKSISSTFHGRKRNTTAVVQAILERERQSALEASQRQALQKRQEDERISLKRQTYLELQRAREAGSGSIPPGAGQIPTCFRKPTTAAAARSSVATVSLSGNNAAAAVTASSQLVSPSPPRRLMRVRSSPAAAAATTMSSPTEAVKTQLPPCVVCCQAVRTHIATPCMHFSFCRTCADRIQAVEPNACPVCFEPNVSFSSVAV